MRQLLFSVTINDCEVQTFRCGGNGGQNVNKVSSGVRIIHKASGARGEARDTRDQHQNKRLAFERMARSPEFTKWHHAEVSRRLGLTRAAEEATDAQMRGENLRVEVHDENGRWVLDKVQGNT